MRLRNRYPKVPKGKVPNVMVVNRLKKNRTFLNIPERLIPDNSFVQKYDNEWMHLLILDKVDGKIQFSIIDKENVDDKEISPTDVYVAKNCADEVREVYGISMTTTEKIKWGIFIGLCVGCLILIFFLVFGAGGN